MDTSSFKIPSKPSAARTPKQALIEQIVEATNEQDKKGLARALSVAANTLKWNEHQLHILYQKRLDPKVRNYTALVWYHAKIIYAAGPRSKNKKV